MVDEERPITGADGAGEATPSVEMSGADALARIRAGQTISHAKISRLKLKGTFTEPIKFHNCILQRPEFDACTFEGTVEFHNCTIIKPQFNRKNVFKKDLRFDQSTLRDAVIRETTIDGTFHCYKMIVKGKLHILNCQFNGRGFFWETHAEGWFESTGCEFIGECDMRSMHIEQGLVFRKCRFQGDFLLRGTTVEKKLDFEQSRFERAIDLSKAKLHDFVYMETIDQGQNQTFAFWNALAERILVRPEQLENRLASELKRDYHTAMQEYGLLKRTFESLHRYDYEDWAFYRFKVNQRRGCGRSWKRPWTKIAQFFNWLFLDVGCGYGTNPMRAVSSSLVIIAIFGLIYMADISALHIEQKPFDGEVTDLGNRIMIGLLTSVSVFTSGMAGIRDLAQGWMNIPLIIESLLGTLLFGLFIVAFSRKVIR